MVQPSPQNPNNEQSGVQQDISDGSSNHGVMQGADVGRDSNQISGNSNQISQSHSTQHFYLIPTPEPSGFASKSGKAFRFWRDRPRILVSLVLIPILGVTAFSIPQVRDELLYGELRCFKEARKEGKKAIAVINFDSSLGNQNILPFLETQIKDNPGGLQTLPNVKVCRNTQERVSDSEQAQKLGNKLGAAVVIWGTRDISKLQVRVTKTVKPDLINLTSLPIYPNNSSDEEILPLVTVMTASALSQVYQSENRLPDAQAILEQAMSRTELIQFNLDNKNTVQVLSDAYFNLGNLYDPTKDRNCSEATDSCDKALKNYHKASKLDKKFYEPIVSEGIMYERLRKPLEAVKVWSQIIKSDPESNTALEVRAYRADIYFKQNRFMEAAEDLAYKCQRQSCEPGILHTLGLAQLQDKQVESAKKTYQDIKRYLEKDKKLRAEVIQDLQSLKNKNLDLISTLDTIITTLN